MSDVMELSRAPHLRFNPLRGDWVQVSPQRTNRPWQGEVERLSATAVPRYDPGCYLCPGAARAGGIVNPSYDTTFAFDNDFPALVPSPLPAAYEEADVLIARSEPGICRVVCFSPRHDLALSQMDSVAIGKVVDLWTEEFVRLGEDPAINYVLIFENRGTAMGASNPHPHGQIWATATVPNEPGREHVSLAKWRDAHDGCLLCEYTKLEAAHGDRIVFENDAFTTIVPFWAVWPFEALIVAKRHVTALDELDARERNALADALKRLTTRYDNLFEAVFPYSMGFHQRPTDGAAHDECHLHVHFYPPLLRSAHVRKFMVGFELLGTPQRDLTPEDAASRLRKTSDVHYTTCTATGAAQ